VTIPTDLEAAYHEMFERLAADQLWKIHLNDHSAEWAGRAMTSALLLTGTTPPLYVQPWSDTETGAFGAHVITDTLLVVMVVGPAFEDKREVSVVGVPLVVESLEVSASVPPWANSFGSTPPWPGNLSVVVRVAGHTGGWSSPVALARRGVSRAKSRCSASVRSTGRA